MVARDKKGGLYCLCILKLKEKVTLKHLDTLVLDYNQRIYNIDIIHNLDYYIFSAIMFIRRCVPMAG